MRWLPGSGRLAAAMGSTAGFTDVTFRLLASGKRHSSHRSAGMNALATIRSAPGLEFYLERLELRLEQAVGSHPGLVGDAGGGGGPRRRG